MEQDQECFKFCCKLCSKSFPCGRSLGGHMKSHLIKADKKFIIVDQTGLENSPQVGYGLRENPRKTWRIGEASAYDDKVCRECGKRFQSWKGLVSHMKSPSNLCTNSFEINEQDSWNSSKVVDSLSENEISNNATGIKRTIRRSSKNDSLSVTEIEQEQQEEVAWCLMMLSRDVGHFGGLNSAADLDHITSDEDSEFSDTPLGLKMNRLSKIKRATLETFEVKKLKKKMSHDEEVSRKSMILEKTKLYSSNKRKHQHGYGHSSKRSKYECGTCNKVFRSYQALGGHRASHKKIKGCFASKIESSDNTAEFDTDLSTDHSKLSDHIHHQDDVAKDESISTKSKGHSCPICLKVFRTGQALGGHKRSHLIVASSVSKNNQSSIDIPKQATNKVRDFLDLNLPAPVEEESMSTNHVAAQALKPWWAEGSNHKPYEALVSLVSNQYPYSCQHSFSSWCININTS